MTGNPEEDEEILRQQRDQMLKLVTKGFFKELKNFGIDTKEILRVASYLLDHLVSEKELPDNGISYYNDRFGLQTVRDAWADKNTIAVQDITLRPLQPSTTVLLARWLEDRTIRESFVPAFPETEQELSAYFSNPSRQYFEVEYSGQAVGIVGGENIDRSAGKLEMKKLVGEAQMQGKGIGKKATFGFLYYAFMILGMNKVYIHSRDVNIRNINLNSRFGFELEGIFFEDLIINGGRQDVLRMALLKEPWLGLFSSVKSESNQSGQSSTPGEPLDLQVSAAPGSNWDR